MLRGSIPWRVGMHARLVRPFSETRWRAVWLQYWKSQGVPEDERRQLAEELSGSGANRRALAVTALRRVAGRS
jgi:hypothetical protein